MNQIPNIEEEKGMELILEVLPHLILGNAEELYNNPDGEMAKNTISEMQRVIRETHHHQLQKARKCGKDMGDGSICGCKLDCHLHDWRQRDELQKARQEIADVLCGLLADNYQVVLDPDGNETEIVTLELAQQIIRNTLSNKV